MTQARRRSGLVLALGLAVAALPAGAAGPSFDCNRASAAVDKLVCGDAELAELDRTLAERYARLRQQLSQESFATVRMAQRDWLRSTRIVCAPGYRTATGEPRSAEGAAGCFGEAYRNQLRILDIPVATVGGLRLEGRIRYRHGRRPMTFEYEQYPWLTGAPVAKAAAFNRAIAARLRLDHGLFVASGIERGADLAIAYERWYALHRFDERLISLEFGVHHEANFGHGWREEFAFNWDLTRDGPLDFATLFETDQWAAALTEYAVERLKEDPNTENIAGLSSEEAVRDPKTWTSGKDGAVLLLGHGERSLAGASAEVAIPYPVLVPFLRPGGPIKP